VKLNGKALVFFCGNYIYFHEATEGDSKTQLIDGKTPSRDSVLESKSMIYDDQ